MRAHKFLFNLVMYVTPRLEVLIWGKKKKKSEGKKKEVCLGVFLIKERRRKS